LDEVDRISLDVGRLAAFDSLADALVVIDADGMVRWANHAAEALVGQPLDAWMGRSGLELVHPADLDMAVLSLGTVQKKEAGSPIELRIAAREGWRLMEVLGSHLDERHTVLAMRDLTERRRWEVAGDDVAQFRSVVHNAPTLTVLLRADGTVASVSAAITRQLGHDPEAVCDRRFTDLMDPEERSVFDMAMVEAQSAAGGRPATIEVDLCSRTGVSVPFELTVLSLLEDPTVNGYVVSGHDITRLRMAQEALSALATYDSLTGLLNRRSFDAALEREWMLTQRDGIDSYVVVIDLNRFKRLNDEFGHASGDEALRQAARALHAVIRETDVLGRLGGDEFGVLLVRCGGEAAALGFADRLATEFSRRIWPHEAEITATVGHSSLRGAETPAEALNRADLAMLDAKRTHDR